MQCTRINFTFRGLNIIIYSFIEHNNILHLPDVQHMNTCLEISNSISNNLILVNESNRNLCLIFELIFHEGLVGFMRNKLSQLTTSSCCQGNSGTNSS